MPQHGKTYTGKLSQGVVLYLPPAYIGEGGSACGSCGMFDPQGRRCSMLKPEKVAAVLVCGGYGKGDPKPFDHPPMKVWPAVSMGLSLGGTNCGNCRHFLETEQGCELVEGAPEGERPVESGGCCNAHRFSDPDRAALAEAIEAAVEEGKPVPADLIAQAEQIFGVVKTQDRGDETKQPVDFGRRD